MCGHKKARYKAQIVNKEKHGIKQLLDITVKLFASGGSYGSTMMLHKAPQGLNVRNGHGEQSY